MLPDPVDGYQLLNGYSLSSRPDPESDVESFAPNGLLLGVVDDLVVIHRYVVSPADVGCTASFQALAVDQSLLTVETATASTHLFLAAGVAERIEPTQINGARAWIATRAHPEGEWNALVWSQTPDQIVAVSGQVGLDEVTQLALRLRAVDETACKLALPEATED